jgi:butyryl-CoA dehydrogenase
MTETPLSREPGAFRKMVREVAEETLKPLAERTDSEARFNVDAFEKMADMGLLGVIFSEEYGGMGGNYPPLRCSSRRDRSRLCLERPLLCGPRLPGGEPHQALRH